MESLVKQHLSSLPTLTIIMMDIDDFKLINDRYGHDFGDIALKAVSDVIAQFARATDYAGR